MGKIREGRWRCSSCKTENLGRNKVCSSCGSPLTKDVVFYLPGNEPEVTDHKLLALARSGPNWNCDHCGGDNVATATNCSQCGDSASRDDLRRPVKDITPKLVIVPEISPPIFTKKQLIVGALSLLASLLVCGCLLIPRPIGVVVESKSWERTVATEDYRTVQEEDWDVPARGRIVSQRSKIHHYDHVVSHYETRTRQVADYNLASPRLRFYQTDLGNGFFEDHDSSPSYDYSPSESHSVTYHTETYQDPVYIDIPVYATWYTYDIERWIAGQHFNITGSGKPKWPSFTTSPIKRESKRWGNYTTLFRVIKTTEKIPYTTSSEEEWDRFEVDKEYTLYKNMFGSVRRIADKGK